MKPNIVFVNVDQMHRDAISAFGQMHAKTPCIDAIAREGYSFMKAYTTMPLCVPARASWMTGRMSKEHGAIVNNFGIPDNLPDLGQWLRDKGGYDCFYAGKWHVTNRIQSKSFNVLGDGVLFENKGSTADCDVTRAAVSFFRTYDGTKPFFLTLGLLNPHDCCFLFAKNGPKKSGFGDKIPHDLPPLPANFDWTIAKAGELSSWTETDWRYYLWGYYRLCENVDAQVGRIYTELMNSPFAKNTLFLFTADHGDGAGFHGKTSKGFLYDESWRVPLIAAMPGVIPANIRDEDHLSSGVDIPATICDFAEVEPLPKMTIGKSLRPLFDQKPVPWRDYVVGETSMGLLRTVIRDVTHKSIIYEEGAMVFDMVNDPLEQKNLFKTDAGMAVLKKHLEYFREYTTKIDIYSGTPIIFGKDKGAGKVLDDYTVWYDKIRAGKFDPILNGTAQNEGIKNNNGAGND